MSKGLAIIYDPHNLYQFLWYYSTYGQEKAWDALCLPNGFRGLYMNTYCSECGVFDEVYSDKRDFLTAPLSRQLALFIRMVGFAMIGQRERFCSNFLNYYVNIDEYDEINVMTDVGLVSGIAIGLGAQKRVVIMEDGQAEYEPRSYSNLFKGLFKLSTWKGFLLALLGYSNTGHVFPLRTTNNCIKFSSHPELMSYSHYCSHRRLYDFSKTDMIRFNSSVEKIYGSISTYDFGSYDAIVFTEPLEDFFADTTQYHRLIENHISSCSSKILLKKHPRDKWNYKFKENVHVDIFDQSIPAEVMIPYLKNQTLFFMPYSSILLYLDTESNDVVSLFLSDSVNDDQSVAELGCYPTKATVIERLKRYDIKHYSLIEL